MEAIALNLQDFKQHLVKRISHSGIADQDRSNERYLLSIYRNSLNEMLKFTIHLVKGKHKKHSVPFTLSKNNFPPRELFKLCRSNGHGGDDWEYIKN